MEDIGSAPCSTADVQFGANVFCPRPHIRKSESFAAVSDARTVISDFEHKIWWIPSQADADDCWPGVPNGIADRFLSDSQEILLDRWRQAFFAYAAGTKTTA